MNMDFEFFSPFIGKGEHYFLGNSLVLNENCLDWLYNIPNDSVHAVVTDPPYGIKEYDVDQLEKRMNGNGGVWRIPPSFDGNKRSPLPRFTALNKKERERIKVFFNEWANLVIKALRPGAHVFLASNVYLSQIVFHAIINAGFEFRGQIIRLVKTLRGGDRPKNAEKDYPDVCTMPRGCYEPWGLFRKPIPKNMTVGDCLKTYQTGGLRRKKEGGPFEDVIESTRTNKKEKRVAKHPSLKPQAFLRQIVYAALPLGKGVLVDTFMGSGSTIAAAEALGYRSIGIEMHKEYYLMSKDAIPSLSNHLTKQEQLTLSFT